MLIDYGAIGNIESFNFIGTIIKNFSEINIQNMKTNQGG